MKRKGHYLLFIPCIVLVVYFMIIPLIDIIIPTFTNTKDGMFSAYKEFFKINVELTEEEATNLTYGSVIDSGKIIDYKVVNPLMDEWVNNWNRIMN